MNIDSKVFVLAKPNVQLIQVKQGIQIFKGIVKNYDKDCISLLVTDEVGQGMLMVFKREDVFDNFQTAISKIQDVLTDIEPPKGDKTKKVLIDDSLTEEERVIDEKDISRTESDLL